MVSTGICLVSKKIVLYQRWVFFREEEFVPAENILGGSHTSSYNVFNMHKANASMEI